MSENTIEHPGKILKNKFLDPLGITPYRLAKSIGVHVRRISEIVKGNRSISTDTALRLSLYFNVPAHWWLEMQSRYDSEDNSRINELREIVKPYPSLAEILITPKGIRHLRPVVIRKNKVNNMIISKEILEKLKNQIPNDRRKTEREIEVVIYKNGSQALVGKTN